MLTPIVRCSNYKPNTLLIALALSKQCSRFCPKTEKDRSEIREILKEKSGGKDLKIVFRNTQPLTRSLLSEFKRYDGR